MKTRSYLYVLQIIVIVVLMLLILASCRSKRDPSGSRNPDSTALSKIIETSPPQYRQFNTPLTWNGTVEAVSAVDLVVQVNGRIAAILATDNGRVRKGDYVIRLGGDLVAEQRRQLTDNLDAQQTQLDLIDHTVEQYKILYGQHLITWQDYSDALDSQARTKAALHDARVGLETFTQQVDIKAPITGIFTERSVNQGQDVSVGQQIGKLIDPSGLRIVASLSGDGGSDLLGKSCRIRVSDTSSLNGSVSKILPQSSQTGQEMVWITGAQITSNLRPGQSVSGEINLTGSHKSLAVPQSALVYDDNENPCLFVFRSGKYALLKVKTGAEQDGWAEITAGLDPALPVVTRGAYELYYRQFNEQYKVRD